MTDKFSKAAKDLTDSERKKALESVLDNANETEAGIIRQILGEDGKPLTEKQKKVYEKYIEPALVEKCGALGCTRFSLAGETYCATCAIDYGE
ncbi:hypothetical protein [Thiothrix unzii]|uniref:Uncharacterized protein n=1 Tax=Thiothrix unzii TaxID=111769 RepID=A0A975FBH0_9GAMM|nr:hypothetical protein [Thiothrix unzii]QTR54489.1 hypothetical protein J9260_05195 [Thiothrix unzii]